VNGRLVGPLVFKTSGTGAPRPVGSIPATSAMNRVDDDTPLEVIDLEGSDAPGERPVADGPPTSRRWVAVATVAVLPALLTGVLAARTQSQRDRLRRDAQLLRTAIRTSDAEATRLHSEVAALERANELALGDTAAFDVRGARGGTVRVVLVPIAAGEQATVLVLDVTGEPKNAVFSVIAFNCRDNQESLPAATLQSLPAVTTLVPPIAAQDGDLAVVVNEYIVAAGQTADGTRPVELGGVRAPRTLRTRIAPRAQPCAP